jgi:uncharacterized membrane protein
VFIVAIKISFLFVVFTGLAVVSAGLWMGPLLKIKSAPKMRHATESPLGWAGYIANSLYWQAKGGKVFHPPPLFTGRSAGLLI